MPGSTPAAVRARPRRDATPPPELAPCGIEPLGPVDRAWLEMDDPLNPMIVSAIMELEGPIRMAALRKAMAARLLQHPRFRQRVDTRESPPRWLPDEDLQLDYHLRVVALPARTSQAAFARRVAQELAEPLDRALPLWRITFFRRGRNHATVLFRAHHAIADGIAFMQVLLQCADGTAATPPRSNGHAPAHGPLGGLIGRLQSLNTLLEQVGEVVIDDLQHPSHLVAQVRGARNGLAAVRRVLALPENNPAALRQPLSGERAVAWVGGLPFAPVKRAAHAAEVKVNDLFLAALAGAFGRLQLASGAPLAQHQNLRVSIPVNLRRADDDALGNFFGLVLLDLPIGIADPQERLAAVAERMAALKHSPEARAVLMALGVAGHLPVELEKKLVNMVGGKAVAVVSNLPGPRQPLHIAGARLASLVFWPPQAGGIGIGISLFSYAGKVTMGVSADRTLIPEPQALVDAFGEELALLVRRRAGAKATSATAGRTSRREPRSRAHPNSAPSG